MSGKELRREAWRLCGGRKGFLIGASLLAFLPVFAVGELDAICQAATGRTLSDWWYAPFQIAGLILSLGLARLVLGQADGGEKRMGELVCFFRGGRLGQALLVSLFLYAVSYAPVNLLNLIPTAGSILGSLFSFLVGGLIFPVRYCAALFPKSGAKGQILQGVGIGREAYLDILGYQIMVSIPLLGATLLFVIAVLLCPIVLLPVCAYVAAAVFLIPYMNLAQALYARELIQPPPPKPRVPARRRAMRLWKKDGWYYCGIRACPPGTGPLHKTKKAR